MLGALALSLVVTASHAAARSQDPDPDLPPGIFVDTADGPQEVGVYGSRDPAGGSGSRPARSTTPSR